MNAGNDPCTTGRKYKLTTVAVQPQDRDLVKEAVRDISFPAWKESCDKLAPNCSETWRHKVGPIIGMK